MWAQLQKQPFYLPLLAITSGILLWLGWAVGAFFLFVGFLPILEIDVWIKLRKYKRGGWWFFWYSYLALLTWNLLTTWWIYNSTIAGAIAAITINALLMYIPFLLFRITRDAINEAYGYLSLVLYWLSFEYLHLNWDLSWPWLTLGNAFANLTGWVQWYEITGVLGGTLWVWCINIFLFLALRSKFVVNRRVFTLYAVFIFAILYMLSLYVYYRYEEKGKPTEVLVIQPNIDPYQEKFPRGARHIPPAQQLERMLQLAEQKLSPGTQLMLLPEVALLNERGAFSEETLQKSMEAYPNTRRLANFQKKYENLSIIVGMSTYRAYPDEASAPYTARFREGFGYYDVFNAALMLDEQQHVAFYHKSKLVPAVETIPFPFLFKSLILDFGGASGLMGIQRERSVLMDQDSVFYAPMICYESIYGEFTSGYIKNQGEILCIITNDAWWGDTPGHVQHFQYAKLRAIEMRRDVARSANTGISGFINQKGEVIEQSQYWEPAALKATLHANDTLTFYAEHGDYLGRLAWFMAVGLFLTGLVKKKTGGKTSLSNMVRPQD